MRIVPKPIVPNVHNHPNGGIPVKNNLCQITSVVCVFVIVLITLAPLNTAQANSYLTHVTVTVTTLAHDDGSSTSSISNVDKEYGYHSFQGSHQHESPSVKIEYDFQECPDCFDLG